MVYLWIGIGGFLGANARYLLQVWAANQWGPEFPYGTLMANVSGSFLITLFLTVMVYDIFPIPDEVRFFFAVGFLGSFTTFSSFSYETYLQYSNRGWWWMGANFFTNTLFGLIGVMLGLFVAGLIQKGWQ
ncbi:fluoride efflux transporter CrcB [Anaerolineales bacterium HSG6]|nr:fluoride efflux transporter CrcB [Anaerolineales bacterium HSG6]MDM8530282.1 fluoride efflux transporter CrcB [Anaerolineales bacterium HSG25]